MNNLEVAPACWAWPAVNPYELVRTHIAQLDLSPEGQELMAGDCGDLAISLWQADRCAVCARVSTSLVCDHDHVTALVRGYLCRSCNTLEGVNTDPTGVFAKYRQRPPAAILGVQVRYFSPLTGWAKPAPPEPAYRAEDHPLL